LLIFGNCIFPLGFQTLFYQILVQKVKVFLACPCFSFLLFNLLKNHIASAVFIFL